MKNILFTLTKIIALAFILMMGWSCQKHYEMVDPPLMTDKDDLDEEEISKEGRESYFVTPYGDGAQDGTSWENAMDVSAFRDLLTGSVDLSKSTVYLIQGKYLMSEQAGAGILIKKNIKAIKGGYDQFSEGTDVSRRNVERFVTVFSGDVNLNKKADAGDCSLMIIKKGHIVIDGVTFQYGYAGANETALSSGINLNGPINSTTLELNDCIIRDCVSDVPGVAGQGGAAIYGTSGNLRMNNVTLHDNISVGRGGAIRFLDKIVAFFNGCTMYDNASGIWGTTIQSNNGTYICMNNTTILGGRPGAISNNVVVNGDSEFLLVNTTIIGNADHPRGTFRSNTGSTTLINTLIGKGKGTLGIRKEEASKYHSVGYNVYQNSDSGWGANAFDTDYSSVNLPEAVLTDGVYQWNITTPLKGYATKQSVIDVVAGFAEGKGQEFMDWIGEDAFGVDQRGEPRNPEKMQPGAYDAGLN